MGAWGWAITIGVVIFCVGNIIGMIREDPWR